MRMMSDSTQCARFHVLGAHVGDSGSSSSSTSGSSSLLSSPSVQFGIISLEQMKIVYMPIVMKHNPARPMRQLYISS